MKRAFALLCVLAICASAMLVCVNPNSITANGSDISVPIKPGDIIKPTTKPTEPEPTETTVPETTVPATTVPETTVPETTIPETTIPETTVSETTVPETTVSDTTVPETTRADTTIPETTVPNTTPDATNPEKVPDKKVVTGISVKKGPTKTKYVIGEKLDISGLVITVKYSDGTMRDITKGFSVTGFSSKYSGISTLIVEYQEFVTKVAVTVKKLPAEVGSIEITTMPSKLVYVQGEAFDPEGMVVTVRYTNGTKRETKDYTVYADTSVVGTQTVSVTYAGKIVTFSIDVEEKPDETIQDTTGAVVETENTPGFDELATDENPEEDKPWTEWALCIAIALVILISGYKVISDIVKNKNRQ